jgi:uroporphyrinogen decarboxylase
VNRVPLKNDLLLRALLREPTPRTPVWIMRQAGRYLPEYRKTRAAAGSFLKLMRTPDLACEVTLQPITRFPLDAAILFSDILTIPAAMGLGLKFMEGEGPSFERPVREAAAVAKLGAPDPEQDLGYVLETIRLIQNELAGRVPLIGFAGSPWTLACYMVEGAGSKEFAHIKGMRDANPASLHKLLALLANSVGAYLNAQVAAGVQAVMLFDTWGGVLSGDDYREFSLRYMHTIVDQLVRESAGRRVPAILFTKGGGAWLESMAESGTDALGIDWTQDLGDARRRVGSQVALQGNMEPAVLLTGPDRIREEVGNVLRSFGKGNGHVFNLGHGITPDVDPENVAAMIAAVHDLSPAYHT